MSLNCPMCNRNGCEKPAAGVLAIQLFPPASVMKHYRSALPLTHVVIGLELCEEHAREVVPAAMLGANFGPLVATVERATGTTVDVEATKPVLLPFDHPDVLRLRAAGKGATA